MAPAEIIGIIAGSFLGIQVLSYLGMTFMVVRKLMHPKKRTTEFLIEYETREKKFDKSWLDIPFRAMQRQSRFGYPLYARLYMNQTPADKFILLLHGHNSSSIGQLKYLSLFRDLGYNVFIPDHRRSGDSGGRSITFGSREKYDVIDWIDILQKEYPSATFALFGESMGAATAIMVAGLDKRIRFLIEYCGFANFQTLATAYMKSKGLYTVLKPGLSLAALFYGSRLKETDALSAMKNLAIPVLIMHSKTDKVVDVSNAYALMKAKPDAKVKLFEDSVHARSLVKYPEEFRAAVTEFVKYAESENNRNVRR
jgi:fermentation-respiration switch protein FrsA (DUF1100 family)